MNNWKKFRTEPRHLPRQSLAGAAQEKTQAVLAKYEKRVITSATLPTWNRNRLANARRELSEQIGSYAAEYKLALICLNLFLRRLSPSEAMRKRARFNLAPVFDP